MKKEPENYDKSCYELLNEHNAEKALKIIGVLAGIIVVIGILYFILIVLFSL